MAVVDKQHASDTIRVSNVTQNCACVLVCILCLLIVLGSGAPLTVSIYNHREGKAVKREVKRW